MKPVFYVVATLIAMIPGAASAQGFMSAEKIADECSAVFAGTVTKSDGKTYITAEHEKMNMYRNCSGYIRGVVDTATHLVSTGVIKKSICISDGVNDIELARAVSRFYNAQHKELSGSVFVGAALMANYPCPQQ